MRYYKLSSLNESNLWRDANMTAMGKVGRKIISRKKILWYEKSRIWYAAYRNILKFKDFSRIK